MSDGPSIERVFLGWNGPILPAAADHLKERASTRPALDLSDTIVVVPGRRAGRRLIDLLAERAGAVISPRIVTAGDLPELLYISDLAVADILTIQLAWMKALRSAPEGILRAFVSFPPESDDVRVWLSLANDLAELKGTLASDRVTIAEVGPRASAALPEFPEEERWKAIDSIHRDYLSLLKRENLTDIHEARFTALRTGVLCSAQNIVLLGTADLNGVTRAMLSKVATPSRPRVLIHAPACMEALFDDFGSPLVEDWSVRRFDLSRAKIEIADDPADEIAFILKAMQRDSPRRPDEITIGLGNEKCADRLVRSLALAGIPARPPAVCSVGESAPWILLRAMAEVSESPLLRAAAILFRHPDLSAYLLKKCAGDLPENWLSLVEDDAAASPLHDIEGPLGPAHCRFNSRNAAITRKVCEIAARVVPRGNETASLPKWSRLIAELLRCIYEDQSFSRHDERDRRMIEALERMAVALSLLERTPPSFLNDVTFANAVHVLGKLVENSSIPPEGESGAVELLGWLELALDDAPQLIISAFNERHIPLCVTSDPFLPDAVCRLLGLNHNGRRYARDAFLFESILASRSDVTIVSRRRDEAGDPLMPSRLLLACDEARIPAILTSFFEAGDGLKRSFTLLNPGIRNELIIPPPVPQPPLQQLRVTSFRDFIACPYRFYLRHVIGCQSAGEAIDEWTAAAFGTVAHEALRIFGSGDCSASTNADEIYDHLCTALDHVVAARNGDRLTAAMAIQVHVLKGRFYAFAAKQAAHARAGWRIIEVERKFEARLDVEGTPFLITGHIDRIDRNASGELFIIDYKCGDAGHGPEKKHRRGPRGAKRWTDLQLPLYRVLARANGFTGAASLAYAVLSRTIGKIGFEPAEWSDEELDDAEEIAKEIIREIRAQRFWPPEPPPGYDDGLGDICMDTYIGREDVIAEVTRRFKPEVSRLVRS